MMCLTASSGSPNNDAISFIVKKSGIGGTMVNAKRRDIQAAESELVGNAMPRLLNIPDAAKYMGCTVWFVRTLIWSRQVPFIKFGKRFLFDRHDLDRFIDSQKCTA
jgi:excisionase family DNA binding protein